MLLYWKRPGKDDATLADDHEVVLEGQRYHAGVYPVEGVGSDCLDACFFLDIPNLQSVLVVTGDHEGLRVR